VTVREIARAHRDEWLGPLQALGPRCRFARGLVALEADCPTVLSPSLSAAVQTESFNWVEKLDLDIHTARPEGVTRPLAGSPLLARLRWLNLCYNHLKNAGVAALASAGLRNLAGLRWLALHNTGTTSEAALALARLPYLQGLEGLDLRGNTFFNRDRFETQQAAALLRERFGSRVLLP
jgi:hypothetical protein